MTKGSLSHEQGEICSTTVNLFLEHADKLSAAGGFAPESTALGYHGAWFEWVRFAQLSSFGFLCNKILIYAFNYVLIALLLYLFMFYVAALIALD